MSIPRDRWWMAFAGAVVLAGTWRLGAGVAVDTTAVVPAATATADPGTFTPIPVDLYDKDPQHLWNRLHSVLFVRKDAKGAVVGVDEIDPPVRKNSTYIFDPPRLALARATLEEFLAYDGAKLIRDPLKRAFLQHDLRMLFDSMASDGLVFGSNGKRPESGVVTAVDLESLRKDIVRAMQAVALTSTEINRLPDNLLQALEAGAIPKEANPAQPDKAYLTLDIRREGGSWVGVEAPSVEGNPPIPNDRWTEGRNGYAILVRLPGGHAQTVDFLENLRRYPTDKVLSALAYDARPDRRSGVEPPSAAPLKFPAGTQFALIRQMMVIDNTGRLVGTPVLVSVQIRTFGPTLQQTFSEYYIQRRLLFAGTAGGMAMRGQDEKTYDDSYTFGVSDPLEAQLGRPVHRPILQWCVSCHSEANVMSFVTFRQVLPYSTGFTVRSSPLPDFKSTVADTSTFTSWIALGKYWPHLSPVPDSRPPTNGGRSARPHPTIPLRGS